jgi:malonyl-CoA O-methyltransferase
VSIQRSDGAYPDPDQGLPYIFDTAQALRGLLASVGSVPEAVPAARLAAEYLMKRMIDGGRQGFELEYANGIHRSIPESIHLYALPPLIQASRMFGKKEYRTAAERCLDYYCGCAGALLLTTLTHYLAYELDALIDLDRAEVAAPILDELRRRQAADGSVPGQSGVRWVCSPGLAQLAVCWYKTHQWRAADRALSWLEAHQEASGGFLGSYGRGARYLARVEPSWAPKFYLDAHYLRVKTFFDRNAGQFPSTIPSEDGRSQILLSLVRAGDRVLEVGCGKGRFLGLLNKSMPGCECVGVDLSAAMLGSLPSGVSGIAGSLESIPCADNAFDLVFSVEAIEHSVNPAAAVAELIRVTRPGGWVVVIDKQWSHWGRMSCPAWERWPEDRRFRELLSRGCDRVTADPVTYGPGTRPDGMMLAWRGQKRSSPSRSHSGILQAPS